MTHLEIKRRIVGTRRDDLVTLPAGDLHDVIVLCEATAEREAVLRRNIQAIATICDPDAAKLLRAALKNGGES